jgi:hypothetical protein
MSFIDDFSSIKADLARIESDKKPKAVEVTEGKATDWADVYGYTDVQKAYGWPYDAAAQLTPFQQYVHTLNRLYGKSQTKT